MLSIDSFDHMPLSGSRSHHPLLKRIGIEGMAAVSAEIGRHAIWAKPGAMEAQWAQEAFPQAAPKLKNAERQSKAHCLCSLPFRSKSAGQNPAINRLGSFKAGHPFSPVRPCRATYEIGCIYVFSKPNPPLRHEATPESLGITASAMRFFKDRQTFHSEIISFRQLAVSNLL